MPVLPTYHFWVIESMHLSFERTLPGIPATLLPYLFTLIALRSHYLTGNFAGNNSISVHRDRHPQNYKTLYMRDIKDLL